MSKGKVVFYCRECGYESPKWLGQCPGCKQWSTFVEEKIVIDKRESRKGIALISHNKPKTFKEISLEENKRVPSGYKEMDRVLGGGIVKGSMVLVGGDPGIGKSTMLLQICKNLSDHGYKILYISGEESVSQIKLRGERIGEFNENLLVVTETNMELVRKYLEEAPIDFAIIDSIQTMYSPSVDSSQGSVTQIKECTNTLLQISKGKGISMFIVGHVTKGGEVAGPKILEHMVDTVLYFEGEKTQDYRIIRSIKNRFGATNEIGVFEMRREGLFEVSNPSEYLLEGRGDQAPGCTVTALIEGTRPLLVEVQGLVSQSYYAAPMRTATGFDKNRLNMLIAVLDKRVGITLGNFDGYVNIAGGIKIMEPAGDLSVCAAIISAYKNKPIDNSTIIFGEVGLSGEVRQVTKSEDRVLEGYKMGFTRAVIPFGNKKSIDKIKDSLGDMELFYVRKVGDLCKYM